METIFGPERTGEPLRKHSEGTFRFLNRAEGPFWDRTRETIEKWFSRFPTEGRAELSGRLRSGDENDFSSAFWELYLHEALSQDGFLLTPHPSVPGTSSRPDFLVERNGTSFYLEATVVGAPAAEAAAERRRNDLYDLLEELHSPNFFLLLEVDQGPASPSVRRLRDALEAWLAELDPNEVAAAYERGGGLSGLPSYNWSADDWSITFRAFPKPPEVRGRPGIRPLASYGPARAFFVGDVRRVRSGLADKAGRYGTPDLPFLLAVSVDSLFFDGDYTMKGALFGQDAVQFDVHTSSTRHVRVPDGLWMSETGPRHRRVSAVVAARSVRPFDVTGSGLVTWHNPWAARPLSDVLPWASVSVDLGRDAFVTRQASRPIHEVLGVPEGWPGPEDRLKSE